MTYLSKHPAFNDELLPENNDLFQPKFMRDTKGTYFMQLPGYGKWKVSVEPGSKIISQGSETEDGKPATNPDSIMTGSLYADTVIKVGDNIYLDAGSGCIFVGDYIKQVGPWISMCGDGLKGYNGQNLTFAYFLEANGSFGPGDVMIGDYTSGTYIWWDDSTGILNITGSIVIAGDIQSANYVAGTSGYKLTYATGSAEFQDILARGTITMEPGSSGSADMISETVSRFWAIEPNANNTQTNTALNTTYVGSTLAAQVEDGTARALNALNASYHYKQWLNSADMINSLYPDMDPPPNVNMVLMDSNGIYGFRADPDPTKRNSFWLDATTGNAMIRGTIFASAGLIANWAIDVYRIWKQVHLGTIASPLPPFTKIEMSSNDTGGAWPHFQVFTDNNSAYSSPTGIQMTVGNPSVPVPRIDIYKDGIKRVMLSGGQPSGVGSHEPGLYWFDTAGNVTSKIIGSNADGDVTFGGGVVRMFANGIRISYPQGLNISDNSGRYFQAYVKGGETYGNTATLSTGANNFLRIENDGAGAIAHFNGVPGGQWALNLYGNLGLNTRSTDGPGTYTGTIYYNTSSNTVKVRKPSGWVDIGGGTLPGGGDYQMLRFDIGTLQWVNTSNVYIGSNSGYNIVRDGGGDMYFNVPAGMDYAFRIGGSFKFTINNNIWCSGELFLGPTSNLNIRWTGSQCYINRDTYVAGSIRCSGSVEMSTGRVRVGGTDFYVRTGAFDPTKSYLRT